MSISPQSQVSTQEPWSVDYLQDSIAKGAAYTASVLTGPVCYASEAISQFQIVDDLHPDRSYIENLAEKASLMVQFVFYAALATVTTLPGIIIRYAITKLQQNPFLYERGNANELELGGREFSMLSWNVCTVPAGYSICKGGVTSWYDRIDAIEERIKAEDKDVVCLYEVFDTHTSFHLKNALKDDYAHFYFNIGPKAIGASSGIFVASKFAIDNPNFIAFPKEILAGSAKHSEKGLFSFDLKSRGEAFARIYATHLGHSEIPGTPTPEEVDARREQMNLIYHQMLANPESYAKIVTGDLNLDLEEYYNSDWSEHFFRDRSSNNIPSWFGDRYCATMLDGIPPSEPCMLDYTSILEGTASNIETTHGLTGYNPNEIRAEGLSDHALVNSNILLNPVLA